MLCETRLATGSPVAGLKTLNRIEQVLARSECLPPARSKASRATLTTA